MIFSRILEAAAHRKVRRLLLVLALAPALTGCPALLAVLGIVLTVTDDAESVLTGTADTIHSIKGAIHDNVPIVGPLVKVKPKPMEEDKTK